MIVGIFHPTLNICGGAEWVAVNIINSLKNEGYRTVVLTNEKIHQDRIMKMFGSKVNVDTQIIFPLEPFSSTDLHNVYTDAVRTLLLKSKCDVLIDTCSNAILPGVNITYIHYPLFGRLKDYKVGKLRRAYYLPYLLYERIEARNSKRLIFSNSKYTAHAIRSITGINPSMLYPPISKVYFLDQSDLSCRENIVVSVSRISREKGLTIIPYIARLTNKKIRFLIVGIKQSSQVLNQILNLIERNGVSDRVEVMTDVSREELRGILRRSKVFFHPTRGEHFGVSIVEAMASGCVPIVHDSGGPVEFVPQRFRFNGVEEAARKIEKAISEWSPRHAKQFIQTAQPFSEEKFSKRFLKILDSYTHVQEKIK